MATLLVFSMILLVQRLSAIIFWIVTAIAVTSLCLSWTIVTDIILCVNIPTKRSFALAINMLICGMLGDAPGPYIIGAISDFLRKGNFNTHHNNFTSLQLALLSLVPLFALLSSGCYLFASIYIINDKEKVESSLKSIHRI